MTVRPLVPPLPTGTAGGNSAYVPNSSSAALYNTAWITFGPMAGDPAFGADSVDVSPEWVRERHEAGEIQLIDVREDYEWDAGRLAGARHIELQRVAAEADSIDREKPVVFYCRVGSRSGMAAQAFRGAGYDAYSLDGGIAAWQAGGLPLEPADGQVADH
jgi:rhodanese-related sulfurtransferase